MAIALIAFWCADMLSLPSLASIGFVQGLILSVAIGFLLTRVRGGAVLLVSVAILLTAAWATVRYTSLSERMVANLQIADAVRPADAIVVLASWVWEDGSIDGDGEGRLVRGFELASQGYAPRLIVSRLANPGGEREGDVTRQVMDHLRITTPLSVVGPIANTHDEAVLTAKLAEREGWRRILLVTSPVHTKRAVKTFQKAGLIVTSVPSAPVAFGPVPRGWLRLRAFQLGLHEYIGLVVYQRRGWI